MRLLHRAWPHRNRAIVKIPTLPAKRLRLGPGVQDQVDPFLRHSLRLIRIAAIRENFVRCAAQEQDHHAAVAHRVQHRQLFSYAHRIRQRQ